MNLRPNLSKKIEITSEMRNSYNACIKSLKKSRKAAVKLAILFLVSGFLIISNIKPFHKYPIMVGIFLFLVTMFLTVKANKKHEKVREGYFNHCLSPIIKQYFSEFDIREDFENFPLYGSTERKAEPPGSFHFLPNKKLGIWLKDRCVIPCFNTTFENDFVIDTLSHNDEGFLFSNAAAETTTGNGTDSKTHIHFQGPIIVTKFPKNIRSGIRLYTTTTSMGKERSNGYIKINTIDTENDEFNRNFEVDAEDESQAFFVLSPLVMERLLAIKKKHKNFGVYLRDNYLVIGINLYKLPLSIPFENLNQMSIEKTASEITEILSMIYDFKDAFEGNIEADNPFNQRNFSFQ